ncbi:hypothetical protein [Desulfocurvus sp. DL9XJH121]
MRLAVFSVIHPGVAPFLPAWAESVAAQDDRDFDLCLALDGLDEARAVAACGRDLGARWFPASAGAGPGRVRGEALAVLVEEYEAVVLVDSDDVLLPGRVGHARGMLALADLTCCAMRVVDEAGRECGPVFTPGPWLEQLHRVNVFGFTNSAYRSEALRAALPLPDDCLLVDWLVACRAVLAGFRARIDGRLGMDYRQYGVNTARILAPFNARQVLRATRLVLGHYVCLGRGGRLEGAWAEAARDAADFSDVVNGDAALLAAYVQALNGLEGGHVWWSCVAHPDLEEIWKN